MLPPGHYALWENGQLHIHAWWSIWANASTEAATNSQPSARVSDPPGPHPSSPSPGTTSPTPEGAPAADAAIFSPFAQGAATPARRQPARDRDPGARSAEPTFSVAAALAAVAALAYLFRRASR